jgi:hypothetical protein
MKDENDNGYFDVFDNLIYFLVAVVPIGILVIGVLIVTVGIIRHDKDYQSGGTNLAAMGGVGSGLSLIRKPDNKP